MPYTTSSNYNWLFDLNTNNINDDFSFHHVDCNASPPVQADVQTDDMTDLSIPLGLTTTVPGAPIVPIVTSRHHEQRDDLQAQVPLLSQASSTDGSPNARSNLSSSSHSTKATSITSENRQRRTKPTTATKSTLPSGLERPMTLMSANPKLPKVDAVARSHILQLVESVQPVAPSGDFVTSDHAFLSLSALQTYSDLFFTRFNAAYPLIHLSSFEPAEVETLLLVAVLLLGATYSEKDSHQIAVRWNSQSSLNDANARIRCAFTMSYVLKYSRMLVSALSQNYGCYRLSCLLSALASLERARSNTTCHTCFTDY